MRSFYAVMAVVTVCAVSPAMGEYVIPWDTTNLGAVSWGYNFDDGAIPPTVVAGFNTNAVTAAPQGFVVPQFSSAAGLASLGGTLSLTDTGELRIDVPNGREPRNIKHFWFAFDFTGDVSVSGVGTDDPGSVISGPIVYTANTTSSHIEGYVNILPQSYSEWITLDLGTGATIDNLNIGSYCEVIPEPASAALMLLLFPLMVVRRNFCSDKKQGSGKLYIHVNKLFSYFYSI